MHIINVYLLCPMISAPFMPDTSIRWSWTESQIGVLEKYSCIYIIYKDIFCVLKWRLVVYYLWSLDVTECKVTCWCPELPYIFLVSVITSCSQKLSHTTNYSIFYFSLIPLMYIFNKKFDPNILSFCLLFAVLEAYDYL